jgi:nicotine blue oxidoreductase
VSGAVGAVVLAAGAGRRFAAAGGGVKLLTPYAGRPLLEAPLRAVAAAGVTPRVVVLGAHAEAVLAAVELHGARPLVHAGWRAGMASSLRAGLAALGPACVAAIVVLGDGPALASAAVARVAHSLAAGSGPLVSARYASGLGHPVGLARGLWAQLPERGDAGARALGLDPVEVDCLDLRPPGDADVPAALHEPAAD